MKSHGDSFFFSSLPPSLPPRLGGFERNRLTPALPDVISLPARGLPRPAAPPARITHYPLHVTQVPGAAPARPRFTPGQLPPRARPGPAAPLAPLGGAAPRGVRAPLYGSYGPAAPRPGPTSAAAGAAVPGAGPADVAPAAAWGRRSAACERRWALRDASAPPAAGASRGVAGVRAPGAASSGGVSSAPGLSPRSGRAPGPSLRHLPPLLPAVTVRAPPRAAAANRRAPRSAARAASAPAPGPAVPDGSCSSRRGAGLAGPGHGPRSRRAGPRGEAA